MEAEEKKELNELSNEFYSWLEGKIRENWYQRIPDPVDAFIHYGGEAGKRLGQMMQEYEGNEQQLKLIDSYIEQVVRTVENGTLHGGYRAGAGRPAIPKRKKKSCTMSLSVSPEEAEKIKELAKASGKSVSSYLVDRALSSSSRGENE